METDEKISPVYGCLFLLALGDALFVALIAAATNDIHLGLLLGAAAFCVFALGISVVNGGQTQSAWSQTLGHATSHMKGLAALIVGFVKHIALVGFHAIERWLRHLI